MPRKRNPDSLHEQVMVRWAPRDLEALVQRAGGKREVPALVRRLVAEGLEREQEQENGGQELPRASVTEE